MARRQTFKSNTDMVLLYIVPFDITAFPIPDLILVFVSVDRFGFSELFANKIDHGFFIETAGNRDNRIFRCIHSLLVIKQLIPV
ncbi:hypothetical protein SDC9_115067 [bioreactor metagenome]|uniref:Uncharacterized protein n=1 Tax=bioreactor metagenome TaxID=1076179 RepID=A0A645BRZ3_9ZZZZ